MVRKILEAKRPLEYDRKLIPRTDTNPESFGFPSLESYMSVVIFMCLSEKFPYIWFYFIAVCVIFIIGFSRVYTNARFSIYHHYYCYFIIMYMFVYALL